MTDFFLAFNLAFLVLFSFFPYFSDQLENAISALFQRYWATTTALLVLIGARYNAVIALATANER